MTEPIATRPHMPGYGVEPADDGIHQHERVPDPKVHQVHADLAGDAGAVANARRRHLERDLVTQLVLTFPARTRPIVHPAYATMAPMSRHRCP